MLNYQRVSYPFKMDKTWSFYHSKWIKHSHFTIQHGRKVGALGGLNKPKCLCLTLFGTPTRIIGLSSRFINGKFMGTPQNYQTHSSGARVVDQQLLAWEF